MLRANLQEIIQDHAEFRDFVDEKARHIPQLIIAYGRRLQVLEVQQAMKGMEAPASLILEIQDIRTELEKLYAEAQASEKRTDTLVKRTE